MYANCFFCWANTIFFRKISVYLQWSSHLKALKTNDFWSVRMTPLCVGLFLNWTKQSQNQCLIVGFCTVFKIHFCIFSQLQTHWSHSSFSASTIDSKIKDACKISSTNTKAARIKSIWPHPHTAGFRWPLTFSLRIKILFPAKRRRKVYSTVQLY